MLDFYKDIEVDNEFVSPEGIRLDNTKRSDFEVCPRMCYFKHFRGLAGKSGSAALRYGSTWHKMMEVYYGYLKDHGWAAQPEAITLAMAAGKRVYDEETQKFPDFFEDFRNFQNCAQAFVQYLDHFAGDEGILDIVETEQPFCHHVTAESDVEKFLSDGLPPIEFTGKIDERLKLSGVPYILDHKTTASYISTQVPTFQRSPQLMGYSYVATREFGEAPQGTIIQLHQIASRRKKDGDWGKLSVDFARVIVVYTDHDLDEWKKSFLVTCKKLYTCYTYNVWPMKQESCFRFGRPCSYLGLCQQSGELQDLYTGDFDIRFWKVLEED